MTIQNGKDAGQTVTHVHIHLCPKHSEHALERKNQEARTEDDMAKEAEKYRGLFEQSSE
jgi:diadenosine tetraphosphate (Ap4A) HIT family hydrolase